MATCEEDLARLRVQLAGLIQDYNGADYLYKLAMQERREAADELARTVAPNAPYDYYAGSVASALLAAGKTVEEVRGVIEREVASETGGATTISPTTLLQRRGADLKERLSRLEART
jgi:hypothetical protein